jgi:uncharacterized protein YukE
MKRILIIAFFCLVLVDLVALIYLSQKQKDAQERIRESILEDSIKQEVESKKQTRTFITQLEYERQLEDFNQQLERFKLAVEESNQKIEKAAMLLKENDERIEGYIKGAEEKRKQILEEYRQQNEASNKEIKEYSLQLGVSHNQLKNDMVSLENMVNNRLGSYAKELIKYGSELKRYREKIDDLTKSLKKEDDLLDIGDRVSESIQR